MSFKIGEVESTTEKTSPSRLSSLKSQTDNSFKLSSNEKHALGVKSSPPEENHPLHRGSPIKICTDKTTDLSSEKVQISALEKTPEMKSITFGENRPLPAKNDKQNSANQTAMLSSQKVPLSKIPRFQDSCNTKKQSQVKEIGRGIALGKRKLAENQPSSNIRRKTFVVKEIEAQSTVPLNKPAPDLEHLGYTMSDMDKTTTACRRETFVIKAPDIPEGDEDILGVDRRKTFVKKTSSKPMSCENKEKQLVMSEHASEVKQKEDIDFSKFPDVIIPLEMLSPETVNDILSKKHPDTNLRSPVKEKSISPKHEQLNNNAVLNDVNITPEVLSEATPDMVENFHAKGSGSNGGIEARRKKLKKEPGVDVLQDKRISGQNEAMDGEIIPMDDLPRINIDGAIAARPRKSFKVFFESSSSSDCEVLDDIDFVPAIPVITAIPIRGQISSSKPKKVFNFDAKKRKSILKNKSSVKNIHPKDNQFDLDEVDIKSRNDIKSKDVCSEGPSQENDSSKNTYPDSCNSKQKKAKALNTIRHKSKNKNTTTAVIDCLTSAASTKRVDDEYLNDAAATSEVCDKTPPSVALNNHLGDGTEQSKKNDDPPVVNEYRCIDETDKCKPKEAKVISKDVAVDDLTCKKSKKISKKKKENIYLENDAVISKFTDNDLNLPEISQNKVKGSNANKNENMEPLCKQTGRNTYLVHAEVHSPPPLLGASETENKENDQETQNMKVSTEKENALGIKNLEVSVVLSDIFKDSNNIDAPELSHEKPINRKTPPRDNCRKIPSAPDTETTSKGKYFPPYFIEKICCLSDNLLSFCNFLQNIN